MPHTASAIDLPDVNVWLALAAPTHVHHAPAQAYWTGAASPQLGFTRISMLGLTRLVTNPRAMSGRPLSLNQAWAIYQSFRRLPEVIWLDEDQTIAHEMDQLLQRWTGAGVFNASHWTDASLAAAAVSHGARLVSFDHDFSRFPTLDFLHLV